MNDFQLDSRLGDSTSLVCELALSRVLFSNNALFPWVLLVPRQNNLREIIDLPEEDQIILMREISMMSHIMQDIFKPYKLNIAALGNIVEQLHIHIVARYESDAAWPDPVFGKAKADYDGDKCKELIKKIGLAAERYND
jgi:diadenosine tetraphosphate (Ap4A) HIT family hydrolase